MTDDRDDKLDFDAGEDLPVSREGRRAEDAVRDLPTPVAAESFRHRLRESFLAGAIPAISDDAPHRATADPGPRRRGLRARGWAVAASIAAAIVAVAVLRPGAPPAEQWTVVAVGGADVGSIRVDGRELPVASLRSGDAEVRAGARIELPESTTIELRRAGVLALETAPGSRFSIPQPRRGGDGGRRLVGRIELGEVRYVTGPGFAGRSLRIESAEAAVEIVGTTFSVIRDTAGTCVCVESGQVRIDARGGKGGWVVPAGRRRQVFVGSDPSSELPLRPGEAMKLQMFRDRSLPELNRIAP